MFRAHLHGERHSFSQADFQRFADCTDSFSGSDIAAVAQDALYQPFRLTNSATFFRYGSLPGCSLVQSKYDLLPKCNSWITISSFGYLFLAQAKKTHQLKVWTLFRDPLTMCIIGDNYGLACLRRLPTAEMLLMLLIICMMQACSPIGVMSQTDSFAMLCIIVLWSAASCVLLRSVSD